MNSESRASVNASANRGGAALTYVGRPSVKSYHLEATIRSHCLGRCLRERESVCGDTSRRGR